MKLMPTSEIVIPTDTTYPAIQLTIANITPRKHPDINKMTSVNSVGGEVCPEYDKCLGEGSYKTPTPSSPDTCVTNTLSCVSEEEDILRGDCEMPCFRGVPQLTLALIKPDGMRHLDAIEKRMRQGGFYIVQTRQLQLSPEQVSNFYYEHYGRSYFPLLVSTMCEGPVKVFALSRKDAIAMWRLMCGPTCVKEAKKVWPESLRAIYGTPGEGFKNVCHASATEKKAKEEIRFFFPDMILDDNYLAKCEAEDYIKDWVNPTLVEGLTQLCKSKPIDPILWLGTWLLKNNPYKPKMAENVALVPT